MSPSSLCLELGALAPGWPLPAPWDQAQHFPNSAPFSKGP
ncbi:unnamed protein product [Gulo gulo]|uniref:Uncharacterized protein n=1 Tax=Gulo gulo TaxID=48420 RepID=A0A9X9LFW1_GULGU|nr:unnamed protein product [Gulo gulo]